MKHFNITVFGSALAVGLDVYDDTFALGSTLAIMGHTLLYGGGATGQMGAISNGWLAGNGAICGVVPSTHEVNWKDVLRKDCTNVIHTDTLSERKAVLHKNADIQIILPGGFGTLDELFSALCRQQLNIDDSIIIVYNQNGFYDKLLDFMKDMVKFFDIPDADGFFKIANTRKDLVDYIYELSKE